MGRVALRRRWTWGRLVVRDRGGFGLVEEEAEGVGLDDELFLLGGLAGEVPGDGDGAGLFDAVELGRFAGRMTEAPKERAGLRTSMVTGPGVGLALRRWRGRR